MKKVSLILLYIRLHSILNSIENVYLDQIPSTSSALGIHGADIDTERDPFNVCCDFIHSLLLIPTTVFTVHVP